MLRTLSVLCIAILLASSAAAEAGAPLKGVDVKLGKNPGGGLASRVTDGTGRFNFGVLPKGTYRITVLAPKGPEAARADGVEIIVYSTAKGTVSSVLDSSTARKSGAVIAADFLVISSDGVHPVSGVVSSENGTPSASVSARSHPRGIVTLLK
jgi:Carboxypeptidase regulatory-like domain